MRNSVLVLPVALMLAGCSGGRVDSSELPLRLRAQPAGTVAPGDSLRMTAYLVNPGKQPIRLEFEDQCQVVFYVHAPDRTVLHPAGGGAACVGGPTALDLPAGDSVRFMDVYLVTSRYAEEHSAYAVLWEHHVPGEGERQYEEGHRSNIVTFRVVDPAVPVP